MYRRNPSLDPVTTWPSFRHWPACHRNSDSGFAARQGERIVLQRDLLATLRRRELDTVGAKLSAETALPHLQTKPGENVAGTCRQTLTLASGRFAMIDNGLGFQLVPWSRSLEKQLGRHVAGVMNDGGGIDWGLGPKRELGR